MDPLIQLIWAVVVTIAASAAAIVVGRRRGIDQVDARADGETKRLIEAQSGRLTVLEDSSRDKDAVIARQSATIDSLSARLALVTAKVEELEIALARERRVTAAFIRSEPG